MIHGVVRTGVRKHYLFGDVSDTGVVQVADEDVWASGEGDARYSCVIHGRVDEDRGTRYVDFLGSEGEEAEGQEDWSSWCVRWDPEVKLLLVVDTNTSLVAVDDSERSVVTRHGDLSAARS